MIGPEFMVCLRLRVFAARDGSPRATCRGREFPGGRVRQMRKREEQGPHGVDEGAFERLAAVQAVAPVGEKQNSGPRAPALQHGPQGVAGFDAPHVMALPVAGYSVQSTATTALAASTRRS